NAIVKHAPHDPVYEVLDSDILANTSPLVEFQLWSKVDLRRGQADLDNQLRRPGAIHPPLPQLVARLAAVAGKDAQKGVRLGSVVEHEAGSVVRGMTARCCDGVIAQRQNH